MTDLDEVFRLLSDKGGDRYGGEDVSQLQHALQCAKLAERANASDALIVAALLHDIGHLSIDDEGLAERGEDACHELVGAAVLSRLFGPEVTEPVRLHVDAKRYLCATNPRYRERLSPSSVTSLRVQGGPFTSAEAEIFKENTFSDAAIALRSWDESAKDPKAETPGLGHYRAIADRASQGWRRGRLILVVGPSGAGKDTLIAAARDRLADDPHYQFPQRVVTRDSSHVREVHDSVTEEAFSRMTETGAFCLAWQAHGLSYGVPISVAAALSQGLTVVVNTSRGVVDAACDRFPNVEVIHVTAAPATIAARLHAREGLAEGDRQGRVERRVDIPRDRARVTDIKNDGPLAQNLAAFLAAVTGAAVGERS